MSQFRKKCLLVDDDPIVSEFFRFALGDRAEIVALESGRDLMKVIQKHSFDAAFIDLNLPDIQGHEIVRELKNYLPELPVVVISSSDSITDAIMAFRLGAIDFLTKPLDPSLLQQIYKKCIGQKDLEKARQILTDKITALSDQLIIGNSDSIRELREEIQRLKGSELDTLIIAESGCGKELVAKSLNRQETDEARPYITLNCSAIPKELMESILFGHEKGSFTGADKKQIGKFELAHNGDIFLDEIGTLSQDLQAKLLRVLQEREIEPVGAGITKKLNFRVIAATNEDLNQLVKNGTFRKDLYYRLNKMILRVPPLRERKTDIPTLVQHFLKKSARNGQAKTISNEALQAFMEYNWPGNVRELENIIENLNFTSRGTVIQLTDVERLNLINEELESEETVTETAKPINVATVAGAGTLEERLLSYEKTLLESALKTHKKKQDAAQFLGLDRKTLFRKTRLHGLS